LQTRYLRSDAGDLLYARMSAAGTADWYYTDKNNSVRQIGNASGTVIDAYQYDSSGKATAETQPANGDRWRGEGFRHQFIKKNGDIGIPSSRVI
jgi:hypothetical protein